MYHQNPLIGVKGHLQTRFIQNEDGNKKKRTEIVAEKVTFLAQAPKNKEEKKEQDPKPEKQTSKKKKDE